MFRSIIQSDFAKNVFALSIGSIMAQLINFFLMMFITRIYTPADFGLLNIFLSVLSFISVLSTGKYDVAMVVAKNTDDAIALLRLGMSIALILSMLIYIGIIPLHQWIMIQSSHQKLIQWFYFLPIALFFAAAYQMLWMWYVREKKFKNLSYIRLVETISNGAFTIMLSFLGAWGLLAGTLMAQIIPFLILLMYLFKQYHINPFSFHYKELKHIALAYQDFPRYNILQGLSDIFISTGIVIIGAQYFSIETMGLYGLCMRVLQMPMSLIIRPIAHVFFAEASERYRKKIGLYKITTQTIWKTAIILSPMPIILFAGGEFLFEWIFGHQWKEAGIYAAILSCWIYLDMIRAPIAQIPAIVGKQKDILKWSILIDIGLLFVLILVGTHLSHQPVVAFIIITGYQCIQTLFLIMMFLKLARYNDNL